jgi:hypothetical protein
MNGYCLGRPRALCKIRQADVICLQVPSLSPAIHVDVGQHHRRFDLLAEQRLTAGAKTDTRPCSARFG